MRCVTTGSRPVPVGTHTAVLVAVSTGMPPHFTRSAATTQFAVTQGGVLVLASEQPVIAYGEACVTTG